MVFLHQSTRGNESLLHCIFLHLKIAITCWLRDLCYVVLLLSCLTALNSTAVCIYICVCAHVSLDVLCVYDSKHVAVY